MLVKIYFSRTMPTYIERRIRSLETVVFDSRSLYKKTTFKRLNFRSTSKFEGDWSANIWQTAVITNLTDHGHIWFELTVYMVDRVSRIYKHTFVPIFMLLEQKQSTTGRPVVLAPGSHTWLVITEHFGNHGYWECRKFATASKTHGGL